MKSLASGLLIGFGCLGLLLVLAHRKRTKKYTILSKLSTLMFIALIIIGSLILSDIIILPEPTDKKASGDISFYLLNPITEQNMGTVLCTTGECPSKTSITYPSGKEYLKALEPIYDDLSNEIKTKVNQCSASGYKICVGIE